MDLFQRSIFGGSGSTPPVVALSWHNSGTNEERACTYSVCNYTIRVNITDIDNDVLKTEIFMSVDAGVTWNSIISNIGTSGQQTFGDQISTPTYMSGFKWYKAVSTDSNGNVGTSNILKIHKDQPTPGTVVLEYNGVQYNHATIGTTPTNPINIPASANVSWLFKNLHPSDYVQFGAHNTGNGTNAMRVFKVNAGTNAPILTSPQDEETLQPNAGSQLPAAINATGLSGLYYVDVAVDNVNYQGTLTWLINLT